MNLDIDNESIFVEMVKKIQSSKIKTHNNIFLIFYHFDKEKGILFNDTDYVKILIDEKSENIIKKYQQIRNQPRNSYSFKIIITEMDYTEEETDIIFVIDQDSYIDNQLIKISDLKYFENEILQLYNFIIQQNKILFIITSEKMQSETKIQQDLIINIENNSRRKIINLGNKNTKIQPLFTILNAEKIRVCGEVYNIIKSIILKSGKKHYVDKNLLDNVRKHYKKNNEIRISEFFNIIFYIVILTEKKI